MKGLDKENTVYVWYEEEVGANREERSDVSLTCCFTILGAFVEVR